METTLTSSEAFELAHEDTLEDFPRLTGPLGRLVEGITDDIPYEHKALAAVTYVGLALSGRTELAPPHNHLQPRFYACLVGPKGTLKSAAQKEVNRALEGLGNVSVEHSINSGPALVVALKENSRLLYAPDEMAGAFAKAKTGRMFDDFKTLYEDNKISNRVKNSPPTVATGCHFAMSGSCTRESFARMWLGTGGAGDGLQSRFVLSFSEKQRPHTQIKKPNNDALVALAVEELQHALASVPRRIELPEQEGAFTKGLAGTGEHINLDYSRVVDMGRRFALVLAACNGKTQIDDETMSLGRAFISYQIAAYRPLLPPDAINLVEGFEKRILLFFAKHQPASYRDLRNNIRPENSPGGFGPFKAAFNNLATGQAPKLVPTGETNRVGTVRYRIDA